MHFPLLAIGQVGNQDAARRTWDPADADLEAGQCPTIVLDLSLVPSQRYMAEGLLSLSPHQH